MLQMPRAFPRPGDEESPERPEPRAEPQTPSAACPLDSSLIHRLANSRPIPPASQRFPGSANRRPQKTRSGQRLPLPLPRSRHPAGRRDPVHLGRAANEYRRGEYSSTQRATPQGLATPTAKKITIVADTTRTPAATRRVECLHRNGPVFASTPAQRRRCQQPRPHLYRARRRPGAVDRATGFRQC